MAPKPLGSMFVRVLADVSQFTKGMNTVQKRSKGAAGAIKGFTSSLGPLSAVAAGAALAKFSKDMLALGVAAEESASKMDAVFGDTGTAIKDFAEDSANALGLTTAQAQDALSATGALAQGMGVGAEASAAFSKDVLILAADLASFNNVPVERAADAVRKALTGEREALKSLNIVVTEAMVQQRAFALTGKTSAAALTEAEKAAANYSLILEKAGPQVGDLARTSDSAANQLKRLKATFVDVATDIGQFFAPAVAFAAGLLTDFINFIRKGFGALPVLLAKVKLSFLEFFKRDTTEAEAAVASLTAEFEEFKTSLDGFSDRTAPDLTDGMQAILDETRAAGTQLVSFTLRGMKPATVAAEEFGTIGPVAMSKFTDASELARRAAIAMNAAMFATRNTIMTAANASSALINIWRNGQSVFRRFLSSVSTLLKIAGGVVSVFNPVAGAILIGGGSVLGSFAGGGVIQPGQAGLVGENGPEIISGGTSGATITPMGGGAGGMVINIITESGRKLVDTIRLKETRDADMRRVVRIPVAAVATG